MIVGHSHRDRDRRRHRLVACALSVCVGLFSATPSVGAPAKPQAKASAESEAASLKKKGDAAMLALRYEDALEAYAASYALEPNPALHYNRGRALEALGRHAEALDAYEAFERDAPPALRAKVPQLAEHVESLRKRVSTLTLRVTPDGARVVLRNVVLGNAPFKEPFRVNAGPATLEVTAEGHAPWRKEIELPGGSALVIDVDLVPKKTGGTLIVRSDPPANVSIDGAALGTTPVEADLAAGSHTVTLSRNGYASRTSTVVIAAGARKELSLSLESEPGLTSKWWFWTGIGVVVVGATAVTVGLLTTREPGRGDIDPGRISAPLVSF